MTRYRIYDRRTDKLLFSGDAEACAAWRGIKPKSWATAMYKYRYGDCYQKYRIEEDHDAPKPRNPIPPRDRGDYLEPEDRALCQAWDDLTHALRILSKGWKKQAHQELKDLTERNRP